MEGLSGVGDGQRSLLIEIFSLSLSAFGRVINIQYGLIGAGELFLGHRGRGWADELDGCFGVFAVDSEADGAD